MSREASKKPARTASLEFAARLGAEYPIHDPPYAYYLLAADVCNSNENTVCPFLYRSKFVNADNMCEYNLCNKHYYNEKNKPMGVRPLLGPSKGTNS